jgi:hypothetical protein
MSWPPEHETVAFLSGRHKMEGRLLQEAIELLATRLWPFILQGHFPESER